MPPPVDIANPRRGRRESRTHPPTDDEVYENAQSTQVEVEVHPPQGAGAIEIEDHMYDNQEAVEEANQDQSSSVHDDAFNASPPPPVGPRVPNPGLPDLAEEDKRREEAAHLEAEARAARDVARQKAEKEAEGKAWQKKRQEL